MFRLLTLQLIIFPIICNGESINIKKSINDIRWIKDYKKNFKESEEIDDPLLSRTPAEFLRTLKSPQYYLLSEFNMNNMVRLLVFNRIVIVTGDSTLVTDEFTRKLAQYLHFLEDNVIWVNASTPETTRNDLETLAEALHVTTQNQTLKYILRELAEKLKPKFTLFIYLDANPDNDIIKNVSECYENDHLILNLVTSNTSNWDTKFKVLTIGQGENFTNIIKMSNYNGEAHELFDITSNPLFQLRKTGPLRLVDDGGKKFKFTHLRKCCHSEEDTLNEIPKLSKFRKKNKVGWQHWPVRSNHFEGSLLAHYLSTKLGKHKSDSMIGNMNVETGSFGLSWDKEAKRLKIVSGGRKGKKNITKSVEQYSTHGPKKILGDTNKESIKNYIKYDLKNNNNHMVMKASSVETELKHINKEPENHTENKVKTFENELLKHNYINIFNTTTYSSIGNIDHTIEKKVISTIKDVFETMRNNATRKLDANKNTNILIEHIFMDNNSTGSIKKTRAVKKTNRELSKSTVKPNPSVVVVPMF